MTRYVITSWNLFVFFVADLMQLLGPIMAPFGQGNNCTNLKQKLISTLTPRKTNMTMEKQPFDDVLFKIVMFRCHVSFFLGSINIHKSLGNTV